MPVLLTGGIMDTIKFTNFSLFIKEDFNFRALAINDLTDIMLQGNITFEDGENLYYLNIELIDNKYLWLCARYGNPSPCPKEIYDKNIKDFDTNKRTENQVEMRNQLFALYDFDKSLLFCNNSRKTSFLEKYFRKLLDNDVIIKTVFVDIETFRDKIKEIRSIKFKSLSNIFTQNGILNKAFKDVLGDNDVNFELTLNYNFPSFVDKIDLFRRLKNIVASRQAENLILIGIDDNDFEQVYNTGSFSKKIEIFYEPNEEGLKDEKYILKELLEKVANV
jgi:hypothetical protein